MQTSASLRTAASTITPAATAVRQPSAAQPLFQLAAGWSKFEHHLDLSDGEYSFGFKFSPKEYKGILRFDLRSQTSLPLHHADGLLSVDATGRLTTRYSTFTADKNLVESGLAVEFHVAEDKCRTYVNGYLIGTANVTAQLPDHYLHVYAQRAGYQVHLWDMYIKSGAPSLNWDVNPSQYHFEQKEVGVYTPAFPAVSGRVTISRNLEFAREPISAVYGVGTVTDRVEDVPYFQSQSSEAFDLDTTPVLTTVTEPSEDFDATSIL